MYLPRVASKRKAEEKPPSSRWLHVLDEARDAWPGVALADDVFLAHVAARAPDGDDSSNLHAGDLFLACACSLGDARALALFEDRLMAQVPTHVARIDRSPAFADEVKAQLREKLFVARDGAPPKIAHYSGRGPLGGWLRVTAIRTAQNLLRGRGASAGDGRAIERPASDKIDPEGEYFKRRHEQLFREVVEAVLSRVPRDESALLRLHFVDGLTVRAIGKLYRVNASTITRRIAQTRERIIEETRARLRKELAVDDRELDSLMLLMESRVDLTLSRVLR